MQKLLRPVTNKELADYLEIDEYLISEALNSSNPIMSIDEPICIDAKEITLHEVIADKNQDLNTLIALKDEIMKLENIEKEIVDKRYFKDLTQTEIAQSLGMSQVQVSRQEQKVLAKLKQKLV
jgi:RNA polymerase sporulation-specific sigma factor